MWNTTTRSARTWVGINSLKSPLPARGIWPCSSSENTRWRHQRLLPDSGKECCFNKPSGLLAKSLNQVSGTLHVNSWTKAPKKVHGTYDEDLASEPLKRARSKTLNKKPRCLIWAFFAALFAWHSAIWRTSETRDYCNFGQFSSALQSFLLVSSCPPSLIWWSRSQLGPALELMYITGSTSAAATC